MKEVSGDSPLKESSLMGSKMEPSSCLNLIVGIFELYVLAALGVVERVASCCDCWDAAPAASSRPSPDRQAVNSVSVSPLSWICCRLPFKLAKVAELLGLYFFLNSSAVSADQSGLILSL